MKWTLIFSILMFSCNPNQEKPLSIDEKKAFEIFKEVRIADLALESYEQNVRDSMLSVFINEISIAQEISVNDIEKVLIEIQAQPKINKRFLDNFRLELDTIVKALRNSNPSTKKN